MGMGMPIPDLSNLPGQSRPGSGGVSTPYDFQFEVAGSTPVQIKANAVTAGNFTIKWPDASEQTYSGNNASITAPNATEGIVSINKEGDATYVDEFAVVGAKTAVTKVISWGKNPWNSLQNGFKDLSLIHI